MNISAELVKELRERTGAGLMECKRALVGANGNIDLAVEEMRKSGMAKAEKKASRTAAEGKIAMAVAGQEAFMVEVNCETDFVGRDASFVAFAQVIADQGLAAKNADIEKILAMADPENSGQTLEQRRQELIAKIGENIQVRRAAFMQSSGCVGHYKHGERIGVLVNLDVNNPELGKDIAMHIAASQPLAVSEKDVPADLIAKEKEIFSAQAGSSGKPANIIEKMVEGRIKKFLGEISLYGQPFVKNPDQTVADLLKANKAEVSSFVRYAVGEGIEKQTTDFATEVMMQVQGSR